MKRFALVLMAVSAPALLFAQQKKPDFSGTWKLDPQLTRFNGVEAPKALVMKIEHQEPQIHITMNA